MRTSSTRLLAAVAAVSSLAFAACGGDDVERTEANYCGRVNAHLADLNTISLSTEADIDRIVSAWQAVAEAAPIAIEAEWKTMVANVQTAATVDPTDNASMQKVADTARASEPSANRVIAYTQDKCGVVIGQVAATANTEPAATTTFP